MSFVWLVVVPLAAVAILVVAIAALRGRPSGEDPPGLRSYAAFSDDRARPDGDPAEAGEEWAQALARALGGSAAPEDYGWIVECAEVGERFVLRVGLIEDPEERWLVMVDAARGPIADRSELRALLLRTDGALREAGARGLAWHRRERWLQGERAGAESPIDHPPPDAAT